MTPVRKSPGPFSKWTASSNAGRSSKRPVPTRQANPPRSFTRVKTRTWDPNPSSSSSRAKPASRDGHRLDCGTRLPLPAAADLAPFRPVLSRGRAALGGAPDLPPRSDQGADHRLRWRLSLHWDGPASAFVQSRFQRPDRPQPIGGLHPEPLPARDGAALLSLPVHPFYKG